ncbi:UNVERIFIED_CONTAM: hypothetical protein Sindi_3032600 [Sesamum indicum]
MSTNTRNIAQTRARQGLKLECELASNCPNCQIMCLPSDNQWQSRHLNVEQPSNSHGIGNHGHLNVEQTVINSHGIALLELKLGKCTNEFELVFEPEPEPEFGQA